MRRRIQAGYVFEDAPYYDSKGTPCTKDYPQKRGTFFIRYRVTKILADGSEKRVQPRVMLRANDEGLYDPNGQPCTKGDLYFFKKSKKTQKDEPSPHLRTLIQSFMVAINKEQLNGNGNTIAAPVEDMRIVDFWETKYVPYCKQIIHVGERAGRPRKRESTMRGYEYIWTRHLLPHFGERTLQEYQSKNGKQLLRSLTDTQNRTTIKHIKALASSIFSYAVNEELIESNPWRDVEIPDDAIEPERTQHYTVDEAEQMIGALVDHVREQLIVALSCFLGLRPSEIAGLKWEDFDPEYVHIRRRVIDGVVDVPKTQESVAPLPYSLIPQVCIPLELWRQKCAINNNGQLLYPSEGWVFPNRNGDTADRAGTIDLHNVVNRIIIPHINGPDRGRRFQGKKECVLCDKVPEKSGVTWKGLYSGRRGACTAVIEGTNGNYAVAQALLRHKSMTTTLNVYKKQITPAAFEKGIADAFGQKALVAKNAGNGNGE